MATKSPILIYQPGGGTPGSGTGGVDEEDINAAGSTPLIEGQAYIDVLFTTIQTDDEWVFVQCVVVNTTDPDPLNIWPGIVTEKTAEGFTIQLNGMPDSGNYYLHWAISGTDIEPVEATTYTLSGPSIGSFGVESSNFTVALPASTVVEDPVVVTPDDAAAGGVFTPTTVTLSTGSPSRTFTYSPPGYGAFGVNTTNDGGLTDPLDLPYNVAEPEYSLSGPSGGDVSVESTDFTVQVAVDTVFPAPVEIVPSDGAGGGTFNPISVTLDTGSIVAHFTYTPASAGDKTISTTNDGGLPDPDSLTYTATAASTVHLLNTLISYWKMDEATANTRNDSHGTNHLAETGSVTGDSGKINNCASFLGIANPFISHADNSELRVTSDFTFSLWANVSSAGIDGMVFSKGDGANLDYALLSQGSTSSGFVLLGPGGSTYAYTGFTATLFTWYHLVCWYDSSDSKLRIRLNDTTTYVASMTTTLAATATPFNVGGRVGLNQGFHGKVDEVGFWKRKLNADEMTALYNGGSGLAYGSFTA